MAAAASPQSSAGGDGEPQATVYVGLVPADTAEAELAALFGVEVAAVKVVAADEARGRGRHAFVALPTAEAAQEACARLQGTSGMRFGVVKRGPARKSAAAAARAATVPSMARVHVVLCEPAYATNVGAVARLCGSFGTGQMVVVDPAAAGERRFAHDEAAQHASTHGRAWLDGYAVCSSVAAAKAALGGAQAFGFTARVASGKGGNVLRVPVALGSLAEALARHQLGAGDEHIALVVGREADGLRNSELAACDGTVTIPVGGVFNLSHSVAVALYHVALCAKHAEDELLQQQQMQQEEESAGLEALVGLWAATVAAPSSTDQSVQCLRSILMRAQATPAELRVLASALRAQQHHQQQEQEQKAAKD